MSRNKHFKESFEFVYELVRRKIPSARFPCYGGRYYYFLLNRHFENLYFYVTDHGIAYTASGGTVEEIPFHLIRGLRIRQGFLFRSAYRVRFSADRYYDLLITDIKGFSTESTGNGAENVKNFLQTLENSVPDRV